MSKRTPLVIANWKLNGGIDLICASVGSFIGKHFDADIAICPPFIYMRDMLNFLQHSQIIVGSQNISKFDSGAYTGETSALMVKQAGGGLCLIGHSERRQMFSENEASCRLKIQRALACNLMPVYCIGESLQQREAGVTKDVLFKMLHDALSELDTDGSDLCIAYEPVWAIGTGKAATPDEVQEVHEYIRSELVDIGGQEYADKVRVLYGGSVNRTNAAELLSKPDVDGLLVGGASLDPEHFKEICIQANNCAE